MKFNKILAALASMTAIASCASALPTSAVDMSYGVGKNSKFTYTVTTERVSATEMKLILRVTNNPGVTALSLAIVNDADCDMVDYEGRMTTDYSSTKHRTYSVYAVAFADTSNFTMEYTYKLNNTQKDYDFKVGVTLYESPNEPNASFSKKVLTNADVPNDAVVEVSPSVLVRLGDMDNNGKINSQDWSEMQSLVGYASTSSGLSTTYVDEQLKNKNSAMSKRFPNLKCAAVADIDHNAMIQKSDSDALGTYLAEYGAGVELTNSEINTLFPVTVVYDN